MKRRPGRWVPLVFWLLVFATWEVSSGLDIVSPLFFPAPSTILRVLAGMIASGELLIHLGYTLYRLGVGLALGGSLGLLLGLWMGWSLKIRTITRPVVAAIHPLPKISLFPLLLILFGLGEQSKIALVALAAFFPMLINSMTGVQQIDSLTWEVARHYQARSWVLLRRVILPGSLPMIIAGIQLALNAALMGTVAVELLSAQKGLGAVIWLAWQTMRTASMYATLVIIASLGVVSNSLIHLIAKRLMPWQPKEVYHE